MKEYITIIGEIHGNFDKRVTTFLNDGWDPVGGVSIGLGPGADTWAAQALVRDTAVFVPDNPKSPITGV